MAAVNAGKKWFVRGIIVVAVVVLMAGFSSLLPRGFSEDLSRIGQGTAALVLIHDLHSVGSQQAMDLLHTMREDFDGRLEFLLVSRDSPQGRDFVNAHQARDAMLVLFAANGARKAVMYGTGDERALRASLQDLVANP